MMDPVALLHLYHKAQNAFDMRKVQSMFAEDAIYVSPALNGEIKGREAIMAAMRKHFSEYSDQISHDEKIERIDDRTVRSTWSLHATSAFSGTKIKRKGNEAVIFNNNGLIARVEVKDKL